jgi:hypothetical protein
MKWYSENNWYQWNYDFGKMFSRRENSNELFQTHYGKTDRTILDFKTELKRAAASTLEHYPGLRPCIFFSGGIDSEAILRSYISIKSSPLVYVVRYEDDINLYDLLYAEKVCRDLGVKYNIIDFNLKKFYENDAEKISEESQIDRPKMLPHLKFTDCADGLIIVGHSDVRWFRPETSYDKKVEWKCQDFEHDIGCDKYNMLKNRDAIFQWWKWTPGLVLSYTKMKWFQKLVSDGYPGKLGINSTKYIGFKEHFPDMLKREKKTGFEKIENLTNEFGDFLNRKYSGFPYRAWQERTLNELWKEITGYEYPSI